MFIIVLKMTGRFAYWICIVGLNSYWFGLVLWHINPYRLFNVKSCLYIYINKYIFDL